MLERKRGSIPLYRQLEAIIKESIEKGEYSAGDILPAESAYMAEHDVSRITVRQALLDLASLGTSRGGQASARLSRTARSRRRFKA